MPALIRVIQTQVAFENSMPWFVQIWQVGLEEVLMDVEFELPLDWGEKFLEQGYSEMDLDGPSY